MSPFRPQDANVFRPYPDEVPWELLLLADPDEDRVAGYLDADFMRVAKVDDEAVGVYVIRALTPTCYELLNLAVAPAYRRQGLGRWLLGHAIGIAESKGGREIILRNTPRSSLFERTGFRAEGADLRLVLMPE
ncbi:MAG: GNAT family N-acetyltransferase [Pseudomonadota bacterium]